MTVQDIIEKFDNVGRYTKVELREKSVLWKGFCYEVPSYLENYEVEFFRLEADGVLYIYI